MNDLGAGGDTGAEMATGVGAEDLALCTDLYQLTMAAAYHRRGVELRGTFELMVRSMPRNRNFLVLAGLDAALESLARLRFDDDQIEYLRSLAPFEAVDPSFFESLRKFRFRGDVWSMEEGSAFFPGEPVLRVTADLIEAQIVETLLLSVINFQTTIASKAVRMRIAAGEDCELAEFGTRRAHGPEAAVNVARAAYLAGFDSTSNVLAGLRFGIPVVGTMAHSFVMSSRSEKEAFAEYQRVFPDHTIFLVDTYDTLEGVRQALSLGVPFAGVRLDSGDMAELSRGARAILDEGGREDALIFASGDVDEFLIRSLRSEGAPIDAFGVGTRLATSADAPYVGGVYKLVEVLEAGESRAAFKASTDKETYPGAKQVIRLESDGYYGEDLLVPAEAGSSIEEGVPLLDQVMAGGERLRPASLQMARQRVRGELESLPPRLLDLAPAQPPFQVRVDPSLEEALERSRSARRP